jgi:hypothetical protein
VKVYNVYDIFGLNDGEFEVVNSTFVDPVTDILIEENPAKNLFRIGIFAGTVRSACRFCPTMYCFIDWK